MSPQSAAPRPRRLPLYGAVLIVLLLIALLGLVFFVYWKQNQFVLLPKAPETKGADLNLAPTMSHLSLTIQCPVSRIQQELDKAVPTSFPIDTRTPDGFHIHGRPSRDPISVTSDATGRRLTASTSIRGRIQVEKRVVIDLLLGKIDEKASVGIDVAGDVDATVSPAIGSDWVVRPGLGLSARVDSAVAKTFLGDIDLTGHVRGPVDNAINGIRGPAEDKVREALALRGKVERLWSDLASVHQIAKSPTTWVRITPRKVTLSDVSYSTDVITSGLALDLEAQVFIQNGRPAPVSVPLPDLVTVPERSGDFLLSVPVEVTYRTINQQLRERLVEQQIELPGGARATVTGAKLTPCGDGLLLTVTFVAKKGCFASAEGSLYLVGIPRLSDSDSVLTVEQLEYTADTLALLEAVDWLAHPTLLDALKKAAVLDLTEALADAKTRANSSLDQLKAQLPDPVRANVAISSLAIDRLAFAEKRAFAIFTAKGKMSARIE